MKLFSKSKKGLAADTVIMSVVSVIVLASIAGTAYTLLTNMSSLSAIPIIGPIYDAGVIGILFGVAILVAIFALLKLKKR